MASNETDSERLRSEANRLYWDSDRSVNQIAEDLGVSKGSLYEVVRPRSAGLPCPRCGEEMVFPNRTAREKGFLSCPACGLEEEEAEVQGAWDDAAGQTGGGAVVVPPEAVRDAYARPRKEALTRLLAGTALLGVAAGIVLATVLKRR